MITVSLLCSKKRHQIDIHQKDCTLLIYVAVGRKRAKTWGKKMLDPNVTADGEMRAISRRRRRRVTVRS